MSLEFFRIKQINYEELENKKVSIVLTTFRENPKFEVLLESLTHQTVKPLELVIADWLYEKRKEYIKKLSETYKIPIIHVPRDTKGASRAMNIGMINASGDYILHVDDCQYLPYRWIEKHLLTCIHGFLSLGSRYFSYECDFPIEKYLTGYVEVPEQQDSKLSEYIKSKSGIDKYLFLQFGEHQLLSPQDFRLLGLPNDFFTTDNLITNALSGWSYGGNIGGSTEMFLSVNGFNEEMDKGYGHPDCELGIRLFNKGYKSFINLSNWTVQIQTKNHTNVFDFLPELNNQESKDYNWKLYEKACEEKRTWINPDINLREQRKEILEGRKENEYNGRRMATT